MSALLVAGTTSDAGKSLVTAALCRVFARRGVSVAPFKAQNMSNNSMVVGAGEIGRAQWVQALAAGVEPEVSMNPVLLKPGGDQNSHVIVNGQPAGTISSAEFIGGRTHLTELAFAAFDDLASRFDVVVCEGAGSPAEINLRRGDYTNMGLAQHARLPVVVVGDIDRGGVFASLFGTVALLDEADQRLIAGFVINKFRGNDALLQPGIERLTELTGRPTYGVLPWSPDVWLDAEDALALPVVEAGAPATLETTLHVGVVRMPRISNFADVDALALEPDVEVRWVSDGSGLSDVDLVVLPGTQATISDLDWLRSRGIDRAVLAHAAAGRPVVGICGGFQMLGRVISDPDGIEGPAGAEVAGLGLLDVSTSFAADKVLRRHPDGSYEIHHGRVTGVDTSGWAVAGGVSGTMRHGSLESDTTRTELLARVGAATGRDWQPSGVSFATAREARLDLLGDLAEKHLDVDGLLALAREGAPSVPLLPPGATVVEVPPEPEMAVEVPPEPEMVVGVPPEPEMVVEVPPEAASKP